MLYLHIKRFFKQFLNLEIPELPKSFQITGQFHLIDLFHNELYYLRCKKQLSTSSFKIIKIPKN